jgi:5'-3' exonuclease
MRHYYQQLLKGDPTDNIPGVPRVGEVKAAKILAPFTTEKDFQEQVVEQYLLAYGEFEWKDYLLSNAKMIHLQRDKDDYFNFKQWPIIQELS